jgi:hypothetical protein
MFPREGRYFGFGAVGEHKLELRSNGYHSERKILIEKNKTVYESFISKSATSLQSPISFLGKQAFG